MLPLLFLEFAWKAVWLLAIALPAWSAGSLTAEQQATLFDCLLGVVLMPIVIPGGT